MFRDGNVYYDKIMRIAVTDGKTYQIKNNKKEMTEDQEEVIHRKEYIFKKFLTETGYFNEFPISRYFHHDKT